MARPATYRHSRTPPSFPRKRESSRPPAMARPAPHVIPTPHRHSRESGNPAGPRRWQGRRLTVILARPVIPAKAGIQPAPGDGKAGDLPSFPPPTVIPAKAGIQPAPPMARPAPHRHPRPHRHSRESGNPAGPRDGIAGDLPPSPRPHRHSRESGNPDGPRRWQGRRRTVTPTPPRHSRTAPSFPRKRESSRPPRRHCRRRRQTKTRPIVYNKPPPYPAKLCPTDAATG